MGNWGNLTKTRAEDNFHFVQLPRMIAWCFGWATVVMTLLVMKVLTWLWISCIVTMYDCNGFIVIDFLCSLFGTAMFVWNKNYKMLSRLNLCEESYDFIMVRAAEKFLVNHILSDKLINYSQIFTANSCSIKSVGTFARVSFLQPHALDSRRNIYYLGTILLSLTLTWTGHYGDILLTGISSNLLMIQLNKIIQIHPTGL